MAIFTLLESIDKNTQYPLVCEFSAPSNCGTLALELDSEWNDQMLFELPCINFKILKSDGTLFKTFDINMSTVNTDVNTGITQSKPYIIPFYNIPNTGSFHITPMFDKNAISAHNEMEKNGIVPAINTNNNGIVTSDDISIWENTDIFDVTIEFNNENIASGGSGGGGDTPVLIEKTITENGTYNAEDDEADGYSSVTVEVPSDTVCAIVTVSVESGAIVTANGTEGTYITTSGVGDVAVLKIKRYGDYTISATKNDVSSNIENLTVPEYGGEYSKILNFITLTVTIPSESEYTITDGTTIITEISTGSPVTYYLPNTGSWTVSCTDGEQSASKTVIISSYQAYNVELSYISSHIYGVSWDKSSKTTLTRTDDATDFEDPDPYVNDNVHNGSSPFDNCMPWSGMTVEIIDGNSLVKIPKFWYKITNTNNELKIQISDSEEDGFKVAPAFRDIGSGEYDYVYLGRYKCSGVSNSSYKSVSGVSPKVNITRSSARTEIAGLGSGYYQQDFAMYWTICMLYLVEFANWDSQAAIGYSCGNNSSTQSTGASDSMPYHTGTMQTSRTTYGVGCQYRYIEDLWGNVYEWVDGIRFSGSTIYAYLDPSTYSDSSNGTNIGSRPTTSDEISDWIIPSDSDYDWFLYPSAVTSNSNYNTYVCDRCVYGSFGVVLCAGGSWSQGQSVGLFYLYGRFGSSDSNSSIGARLLWRP